MRGVYFMILVNPQPPPKGYVHTVTVSWKPLGLLLLLITPVSPTLNWNVTPTVERLYTCTVDAVSISRIWL